MAIATVVAHRLNLMQDEASIFEYATGTDMV